MSSTSNLTRLARPPSAPGSRTSAFFTGPAHWGYVPKSAMTAMIVAGSPCTTIDSCAWSANECLLSTQRRTTVSRRRYLPAGSRLHMEWEQRAAVRAEAIRIRRDDCRIRVPGPTARNRRSAGREGAPNSAEKGEQDRDEDRDQQPQEQCQPQPYGARDRPSYGGALLARAYRAVPTLGVELQGLQEGAAAGRAGRQLDGDSRPTRAARPSAAGVRHRGRARVRTVGGSRHG